MSVRVFTSTAALSGFSKAKRQWDERIAEQRAEAGLPPLPAWTLHDLRRTMVTVMNEQLGVAPHVVEAVVNHTSGAAKRGVAGVYNRALYAAEKRQAQDLWAEHVRSLIEGTEPKVVPLRSREPAAQTAAPNPS
jgi:hypothetical protein